MPLKSISVALIISGLKLHSIGLHFVERTGADGTATSKLVKK